jgi:LysM repeat protein
VDLDLFKLEKLKISAFDTAQRQGKPSDDKVFEAMFNPATYTQTYANVWSKLPGVNASGAQLYYQRSNPTDLSLDLVLDGTGVDEMGIVTLIAPKTVEDRLKNFLDVCYTYNGQIHEPNYLIVEWGILKLSCRLQSVTVKYTSFDRGGKPLRAELATRFVSDDETQQRKKKEDKKSPDVTHSRVVSSGDTLPLLTKQIYGSSAAYLDVARWNGLDDFRRLTPGQEIVFPPLASLGRGTAGKS